MKGKHGLLPLSLMETEIEKQRSAHKCEGPLRRDKRWKIQTAKLLDKSRDGAQRGFRCARFLPAMNKSGLIRLFLIPSQWRVRASPQIQKQISSHAT